MEENGAFGDPTTCLLEDPSLALGQQIRSFQGKTLQLQTLHSRHLGQKLHFTPLVLQKLGPPDSHPNDVTSCIMHTTRSRTCASKSSCDQAQGMCGSSPPIACSCCPRGCPRSFRDGLGEAAWRTAARPQTECVLSVFRLKRGGL